MADKSVNPQEQELEKNTGTQQEQREHLEQHNSEMADKQQRDRHTDTRTLGGRSNAGMFLAMIWGAVARRHGRAIMAVVASMVGAATLFCLAAICIAVPQQMNEDMRAYGANMVVTPIAQSADSSSDSTQNTTSDEQGQDTEQSKGIAEAMVEHTTEMVKAKGSATYATYRYENVRVNAAPYVMAGIDVNSVRNLNQHWSVDGEWPSDGNVMVGRDVADAMDLQIGSRITVGYRSDDNASDSQSDGSTDSATDSGHVSSDIMETDGKEYRVAGILDTGGSEDQIIYATQADVETLTGVKRGVDVIAYSVNASADTLDEIVESINDMTSMHVKAQKVTKITSSDTRIITMLQSLFWVVSLVVLGLTLVGVGTTISSIVSQRRNEIGLRKALGASAAGIGVEFMVESAVYGLIGGVLGTALGYAFAWILTSSVFGRELAFSWWLGACSLILSAIVAVIAALPPVLRATRIDPAVVLREE